MGKGENARYEQFLLFPQCFQKACFPGVSKGVIVWEWVKQWECNEDFLTLYQTTSSITNHNKDALSNIVGKGENAVN